jgi:hypothetical protein
MRPEDSLYESIDQHLKAGFTLTVKHYPDGHLQADLVRGPRNVHAQGEALKIALERLEVYLTLQQIRAPMSEATSIELGTAAPLAAQPDRGVQIYEWDDDALGSGHFGAATHFRALRKGAIFRIVGAERYVYFALSDARALDDPPSNYTILARLVEDEGAPGTAHHGD